MFEWTTSLRKQFCSYTKELNFLIIPRKQKILFLCLLPSCKLLKMLFASLGITLAFRKIFPSFFCYTAEKHGKKWRIHLVSIQCYSDIHYCNMLYYFSRFGIHWTRKSGYKYALLSIYYIMDGFHMHRYICNMPVYKFWLKYRCPGICSDTWKSKNIHIFLLILFHLFLYLTVDCFIVVVTHCENSIYCLGIYCRNQLNVNQTMTALSKC